MEDILYHGSTNKNIDKFEIGKFHKTGDTYGVGLYLTKNEKEAEQYAGPNGKVYKVKLNNDIKILDMNSKIPFSLIRDICEDIQQIKDVDIINDLLSYNRKQFITSDKDEGRLFFKEKEEEWRLKDNRFFKNRPEVNKQDNKFIITYTDYSDIITPELFNNLTVKDLYDILKYSKGTETFKSLIVSSGYDGIKNNNWYILYKDDRCKILKEVKDMNEKDIKDIEDIWGDLSATIENTCECPLTEKQLKDDKDIIAEDTARAISDIQEDPILSDMAYDLFGDDDFAIDDFYSEASDIEIDELTSSIDKLISNNIPYIVKKFNDEYNVLINK